MHLKSTKKLLFKAAKIAKSFTSVEMTNYSLFTASRPSPASRTPLNHPPSKGGELTITEAKPAVAERRSGNSGGR